jgi:hypothetical protein
VRGQEVGFGSPELRSAGAGGSKQRASSSGNGSQLYASHDFRFPTISFKPEVIINLLKCFRSVSIDFKQGCTLPCALQDYRNIAYFYTRDTSRCKPDEITRHITCFRIMTSDFLGFPQSPYYVISVTLQQFTGPPIAQSV